MGAGMMSWSPGSVVTPAGIFCTALSLAGEVWGTAGMWGMQPGPAGHFSTGYNLHDGVCLRRIRPDVKGIYSFTC